MEAKLPTNGSGKIRFAWGSGEHAFFLGIDQLSELQDKANAGPPEIYARLCEDRWRIEDLGETLRLGLIGGGMAPTLAALEVRRYVFGRPLIESVKPAALVILAALAGPESETVKKNLAQLIVTPAKAATKPTE